MLFYCKLSIVNLKNVIKLVNLKLKNLQLKTVKKCISLIALGIKYCLSFSTRHWNFDVRLRYFRSKIIGIDNSVTNKMATRVRFSDPRKLFHGLSRPCASISRELNYVQQPVLSFRNNGPGCSNNLNYIPILILTHRVNFPCGRKPENLEKNTIFGRMFMKIDR